MNREKTAQLLLQAAVRLSQTYFTEVNKERESRWDDDIEAAEGFHHEAAEIRAVVEECRAAAAQIFNNDVSPPDRARRRNSIGLSNARH